MIEDRNINTVQYARSMISNENRRIIIVKLSVNIKIFVAPDSTTENLADFANAVIPFGV